MVRKNTYSHFEMAFGFVTAFAAATLTLGLIAPFAIAGVGPPVHALMQELEGDFSDLPEQDAEGGPRFGFSTAMYGDTLVVGAPGARQSGKVFNIRNRGMVFVYRRLAGQWQLTQRLSPGFGPGENQCGYSVAVDAFQLLVGCPYHMAGGQERGLAIMYTRADATADFEFSDSFGDSGDLSGSLCGRSVSLLGATGPLLPFAAVSCPGRGFDQGGGIASRPGEVDIYFQFMGWNFAASVSPGGTPPFAYTNFGNSIHLHRHAGDIMLVVGRPGTTNGEILIYQRGEHDVADWTLDHSYDGPGNSQFGYSVHLRGAHMVAGAPTRTRSVPTPDGNILVPVGSFSIALRSCTPNPFPDPPDCEWGNELTEILGNPVVPDKTPQNRLGHAVQVLATIGGSERVIAGEPARPIAGTPVTNGNGRARHYHRDGANWTLNENEPFFEPSVPQSSALGSSLAGDGGWLAIGAPGYVELGTGPRGRVFVYAYNNDLFNDRFEHPPLP